MPQQLFRRFLIWRVKNIKPRQFVLMLSVLVGFASGLAAVVIKNLVFLIEALLTNGLVQDYHNYLYFAYPLVGILLTVTVIRYLIRKRVYSGIPSTLYSISKQNSTLKKHNTFSSIISSALTVGFGGSGGLEGPTVVTSAAIGSSLGKTFQLNRKTKTLLIGCAAAGSMAAIFKAPVAAIVFAIEVIMLDLTMASLIPLLLASISAVITSHLFLGEDVLFHFDLQDRFLLVDVPFYILLGILTGLISIYFTRMHFFIDGLFNRVQSVYKKVMIGGVVLGLLLFVFPPLYGEGYEVVNSFIEGKEWKALNNTLFEGYKGHVLMVILFLAALIFLKSIATSITLSAGGIAGIFAPSLFIGSAIGISFAKLFNHWGIKLSESNFTLVGMGGLMAGVLHAPLTAIFLIAEITGGYELFIPLMIAAAISYTTVKLFVPYSVYTRQLAQRGELITHDKDKAVLTLMKLESEIEKDFQTIVPTATLGELVKVIASSNRNIFPVVDEHNNFLGMVQLDDVRHIIFNRLMYNKTLVEELMVEAPDLISLNENMDSVMERFEKTGAWNLPVVNHGKYVGFVSRSKLFTAYREQLVEFTGEIT